MPERQILTIKEVAARSKQEGYDISEYTVRRAVHTGQLPCRIVGKKYLIAWPNVMRWLLCENGSDNTPVNDAGKIRRIEIA